jgi:hypothetical protein
MAPRMRTYDLQDAQGRIFAFEVANAGIGRRGAVAIVRTIPGVRIVRSPRPFSGFREEEFCEFEVNGRRFVIMEPFGDNSRYWVGPEPAVWCEETGLVREAFVRARQGW